MLETAAGGIRLKCDLASITTPGTYTLVMTAIKAPSIVNSPTGAVNDPGGSAASANFSYELRAAGVAAPKQRVAP